MCPLLLLPVLALPVFWIRPPEIALPIYGVAAAASLGVYALVVAVEGLRWKARASRHSGSLVNQGSEAQSK